MVQADTEKTWEQYLEDEKNTDAARAWDEHMYDIEKYGHIDKYTIEFGTIEVLVFDDGSEMLWGGGEVVIPPGWTHKEVEEVHKQGSNKNG